MKNLFKTLYIICMVFTISINIISCNAESIVTFKTDSGYVFKNETGDTFLVGPIYGLKDGSTVKFQIVIFNGYEGTPEVTVTEGGIITGPVDGIYTLTIKSSATVSITGLTNAEGIKHTAEYIDREGYAFKNEAGDSYLAGTISELEPGRTVKFRITIFNGYEGKPEVVTTAGYIIGPIDGVYTLIITGDTTVSVFGLSKSISNEYEFNIYTRNNADSLRGDMENGFEITVDAGDVIYAIVKVNGILKDAYYVWFEILNVDLGDYTAYDFGFRVACWEYEKWLTLPNDATGTFIIEFFDVTEMFNGKPLSYTAITTMKVTVI